jgi:hypothetical protein
MKIKSAIDSRVEELSAFVLHKDQGSDFFFIGLF